LVETSVSSAQALMGGDTCYENSEV